jgi:hypothetical protein
VKELNQMEIQMKNAYGMVNNAVVTWNDADDVKHSGVLIDTIAEADGCGHYLVLQNYEGGIDEVPMSMVAKAVNPNGEKIRPNN